MNGSRGQRLNGPSTYFRTCSCAAVSIAQALTQRALNGESDRSLKFGKSSGMWLVGFPAKFELHSCLLTESHCGVLVSSCALCVTRLPALPPQFNDRGWDHEDNLGKGKHIEFGDVGQNTVELWTLESGGGWVHPIHVHLVVSRSVTHCLPPPPPFRCNCSARTWLIGWPSCWSQAVAVFEGHVHGVDVPSAHKRQQPLTGSRSGVPQDFFCVAWQGADWDGKAASASTPWKPCPPELRYAPKDVRPTQPAARFPAGDVTVGKLYNLCEYLHPSSGRGNT